MISKFDYLFHNITKIKVTILQLFLNHQINIQIKIRYVRIISLKGKVAIVPSGESQENTYKR